MRRRRACLSLGWKYAVPVALAAVAPAALALNFSLGADLSGSLNTEVSAGATLRTEGRSEQLIGKTNLPGQQQFCEDKAPKGVIGAKAPGINCSTVAGNAAYLALPGAASVNTDNGDLDYNKWGLVNGVVELAPRVQLTYRDFGLDASGLYFYDAVNDHFTEYHPNNIQDNNGFQPRNTSRPRGAADTIGSSFRLGDAYLSGTLPLPGDRQLSLKIGEQVLSLGNTVLLVLNGLNAINPPDVNVRNLPTANTRDLLVREPMAWASFNFTENLSTQAFYQFGWKPVTIPPIGSYWSTNDVFGSGGHGQGYGVALFGKYREDPLDLAGQENRTAGNVWLLSGAGRTVYTAADHKARSQGEFGLSLNYLWQQLNNTSFTLAWLHLHSRFPMIDFIASKQGCGYNATNQATLILDCRGFNPPPHIAPQNEPVPIDSIKLLLDYPDDIDTVGASFSTNLGEVAWGGEVAYHPNQPAQIDLTDLSFAALQPIFPAGNIDLGVVTFPSRRTAAPDYVETLYRHHTVAPQQVIRGYERLQTLAYNTTFTLIKGATENPFGANQLSTLLEFGAFQVLNMPSLDRLQFAAPGTYFHHSAGVDSSGTPNAEQAGTGPANRLNPTEQVGGYASAFSYGYRLITSLSYEEVLPQLKLTPQLLWFQDLGGKSPLPTGEFVSGRKQALLGLLLNYRNDWSCSLRYSWYFGGGASNALSDRDNVQMSISYDF